MNLFRYLLLAAVLLVPFAARADKSDKGKAAAPAAAAKAPDRLDDADQARVAIHKKTAEALEARIGKWQAEKDTIDAQNELLGMKGKQLNAELRAKYQMKDGDVLLPDGVTIQRAAAGQQSPPPKK